MKKVLSVLGLLGLSFFLLPSLSVAQHGHGAGMKEETMKMDTREVLVEGMKITFMVMPNEDHRKMLRDMKMKEDIEPGTTHNITVALKDGKTEKEITDAKVNMKVIDPKGKDQIKALKYEETMKSYDAYFTLSEKGKYQIIVLVKAGDQKSTAGIYYEIK
ncbi:MAG: hypothetical protein HY882_08610 [Deltaproteobacteria bacterium]|nr:hypothetical protein [Deltaproteobacteria bacterium]